MENTQAEKTAEKTIVEELGGTTDVIGLDVIQIHSKLDNLTVETAQELFNESSRDIYKVVELNDEQFLIRATLANLNKITTVIPEDMENNLSMRIQLAIADVLTDAGLKVGTISDEEIAEADAKAEEVANDIKKATEASKAQAAKLNKADKADKADEGTDTEDVTVEK